MYTKIELLFIFTSAKSIEELEAICKTFQWLIEEGFEQQSKYLSAISHLAYRKLTII